MRAPQATWFDVVRDWVASALRALLHGIDRALGASAPFQTAIGYAVIAAGLAVVGYGSYALARSFLRGSRTRAAAAAVPFGDVGEQHSEALRAAALAAARGGRYREAAALLFRSAVRALDERGRVAYDAARTPGEYRRLVRDPLFDRLAGDTEVALFAPAEPSGDLFERMNRTYERLFDAPAR